MQRENQKMIKKIASISSLYLAGIILLVFVIFPHHHHEEFICFTTSHCCETAAPENHQHQSHSDNEGCVSQLFQTDVYQNSRQLTSGEGSDPHHFTISLCTLAEIILILSFGATRNIFPVPRNEVFDKLLIADRKATRAPPVI